MLYRKLKDDISVSILRLGAMRLPPIGGTKSPVDSFNPARLIDEEETQRTKRARACLRGDSDTCANPNEESGFIDSWGYLLRFS